MLSYLIPAEVLIRKGSPWDLIPEGVIGKQFHLIIRGKGIPT
jgi:hypothetical protein